VAFSNVQLIDLAGNAFNGFVCLAVVIAVVGCTPWALLPSNPRGQRQQHRQGEGDRVDGDEGYESSGAVDTSELSD
jgi:hypothetical protein